MRRMVTTTGSKEVCSHIICDNCHTWNDIENEKDLDKFIYVIRNRPQLHKTEELTFCDIECMRKYMLENVDYIKHDKLTFLGFDIFKVLRYTDQMPIELRGYDYFAEWDHKEKHHKIILDSKENRSIIILSDKNEILEDMNIILTEENRQMKEEIETKQKIIENMSKKLDNLYLRFKKETRP